MKIQPMANGKTTIFIVQAFGKTPYDAFEIEAPRQARSEELALAMGEQLAPSKLGVVVFSRDMDYVLGEYGEPAVLATYGEIPVDVTGLWEG